MEEADTLLLSSFTPYLPPSPPSTLSSLISLSLVYPLCVSILKAIDPDFKCDDEFPGSMSKKHRVCTKVAEKIKECGYHQEIGYNTILYPNINTLRPVLSFLSSALQRSQPEADDEPAPSSQTSGLSVSDCLAALAITKKTTITPTHSRVWSISAGSKIGSEFTPRYTLIPPFKTYKWSLSSSITTAVSNSTLTLLNAGSYVTPTVISQNTTAIAQERRLAKIKALKEKREREGRANPANPLKDLITSGLRGSGADKSTTFNDMIRKVVDSESLTASGNAGAFGNKIKYGNETGEVKLGNKGGIKEDRSEEDVEREKKEKEEMEQTEREEMLKKLREEAEGVMKMVEGNNKDVENFRSIKNEYDGTKEERDKEAERLKRELKMKRQMHQMLPDADNNMKKLREIIEQGKHRLQGLKEEWTKHRDPMVERLEAEKAKRDTWEADKARKIQQVKNMRNDIAQMAQEIRNKEALAAQLKKNWESMPKNINRNVYTYRILDIISQIGKQKAEIKRIISDIRTVQKDINRVADTLQRTEAVADETIYQLAKDGKGGKSGDAGVASYRNLTTLREVFEKLIGTVESIGKADNEGREFESKTETLRARVDGQSVEVLRRDLGEVKKENAEMLSKLKAKRG
ncbi:hypothetical protein TrLO_g4808 [Triparma laevis f. longispina]|uniref:Uncharacterized protein n=1 Tax=Triparma laevis f. longispina TaxID=1714387 RepID=A0A9W7KWG6_9STRA|nr:hypothetical protein TrLO_g4808 [Triparma laevis f. longispina]